MSDFLDSNLDARAFLEVSSMDTDVIEKVNRSSGLLELIAVNAYDDEYSKLTYSENPIIVYTSKGRNPEDYIYIEWMETDRAYRGLGYGSFLVEYLIKKYPDKTVIADANDKSARILKKLGVVLI